MSKISKVNNLQSLIDMLSIDKLYIVKIMTAWMTSKIARYGV